MNKIIVTGGYGFIASRLVLHFSKLGFEVIIIEHPESICPDHLKEYEVIKHDITSSNIIEDTIRWRNAPIHFRYSCLHFINR